MEKYHHVIIKNAKYKIPKRSVIGLLYSYRVFFKAVGYALAFQIAAIPVFCQPFFTFFSRARGFAEESAEKVL